MQESPRTMYIKNISCVCMYVLANCILVTIVLQGEPGVPGAPGTDGLPGRKVRTMWHL